MVSLLLALVLVVTALILARYGKLQDYITGITELFEDLKNKFFAIIVAIFPFLKRTNPNYISFFRILLGILLYKMIESNVQVKFDISLVIIGLISDGLDGYIAKNYENRKSKWQKDLGKWLDGLADKIFILAILLAAGVEYILPVILGLLIVAESSSFYLGLRIAMEMKKWEKMEGLNLETNKFGKWKFVFEVIACISLIAYLNNPFSIRYYLTQICCAISGILASFSLVKSVKDGLKALKKTPS